MKQSITLIFLFIFTLSKAQPCIPNTTSLLFRSTVPSPNDKVSFTTNNGLAISDSLTVEAWIRASSWVPGAGYGSIFCKHSWASTEQGYVLRAGGTGEVSLNIAGDSAGVPTSWKELISPTVLTLNTWYHVAGTFDGDSLKIYVNGNEVASKFFYGKIMPATIYPPAIGALSDPVGGRYWKGNIDEVRVWSRALSQAEIIANMNHHLDTAGQIGLAGYWRLNENTGTLTHDLSSNNNNGMLSSSLMWSQQVPFGGGPSIPTISYNANLLTCDSPAVAYQWFFYSNPIPNQTLQTYQPTQPGLYYVQVTDANGCTAMSDPFGIVSVSEVFPNENISLSYEIEESVISFSANSPSIINEIAITDLSGRVIINEKCNSSNIKFVINKPAQGLYLININSSLGRFTRKFWTAN